MKTCAHTHTQRSAGRINPLQEEPLLQEQLVCLSLWSGHPSLSQGLIKSTLQELLIQASRKLRQPFLHFGCVFLLLLFIISPGHTLHYSYLTKRTIMINKSNQLMHFSCRWNKSVHVSLLFNHSLYTTLGGLG